MEVDPANPMSKAPGTKRLKLKCDELLTNFASSFNLRRYTKVEAERARSLTLAAEIDAANRAAKQSMVEAESAIREVLVTATAKKVAEDDAADKARRLADAEEETAALFAVGFYCSLTSG